MNRRSLSDAAPFALVFVALLGFAAIHLSYRDKQKAENLLNSFVRHLERDELAPAHDDIGRAVALDPQNAHYLANQALLEERALQRRFVFGDFRDPQLTAEQRSHVENAVGSYRRALTLNPEDDFVYHNLGWLYWLLRQKQQAFDCLRRAASLDNTVPLYHVSLGLLHEYSGEGSAAAQEYAAALQLSPGLLDSPFFQELQRRAPAQAEQIVLDSIASLEGQLRRAQTPVLKAALGRLYLSREPERAAALLQEATLELPNLYRPWFNLGYLYELRGDGRQMELCYKKSIFLNGGEVLPPFRLAKYYDQHQRADEAIRYYRQAVNGWLNQASAHAGRVRRIYLSWFTVHDDIIPQGLLFYLNPDFDLAGTCRRLSELYRQIGDEKLADYYLHFVEGISPRFVTGH